MFQLRSFLHIFRNLCMFLVDMKIHNLNYRRIDWQDNLKQQHIYRQLE